MTSYTPPFATKTTLPTDSGPGSQRLPFGLRQAGEESRSRLQTALALGGASLVAILLGYAVALADVNALILSVSLLACVFILTDFRIGVILLIVIMPIAASSLFPHSIAGITGLNPLNLLLLGTLVSCLARRQLADALLSMAPPPLVWMYVLPLVFAALIGSTHVGQIHAEFRAMDVISFDSAGGYLRDMLVRPLFLVLFAMLAGVALTRTRRFESLLVPMLVSTWIMSLMVVAFVYLSGVSLADMATTRSRGFFSPLGMHANDLGRLYAIAYALMLFTFAKTEDRRLKVLLIGSMGMVVIALTLTFSRGAFVGFLIVNFLFLLSRRSITGLLIGSLVLVVLLLLFPGAVYERLTMGWGEGLNVISAGRVDEIWLPLLPEVWRSPFYGSGLGSIMWSSPMRLGSVLEVTHPHNAYLQAALDMGLIGLLLLCAFFFHVWKGFRRLSKDPLVTPSRQGFYEGAAVGLVSFLVTGFAGSSLAPVPEQSFLWLVIGMMYGESACRARN